MLKKVMHAAMALTMAAGLAVATYQPAEARGGRGAAVAGAIIGGTILGLAIAGSSRRAHASYCYEGPRRCEWRGRRCYENRWGEWTCRGGQRVCWRPTICE